ncbi:hypothetical protein [Tsukamurella asaccharolytica]|uniref:hypothetical protein n=1 Tax=Tsukamurella asaccharolytica TaxID=2592067 RepID=UPI00131520F2|nr:hypothetical protein [Tsukamurella asaccharolytica]
MDFAGDGGALERGPGGLRAALGPQQQELILHELADGRAEGDGESDQPGLIDRAE